MKFILYLFGGLVSLVLLVFLSQLIASESAEVVVLSSQGAEGEEETRLWVVDLEGVQYLRAGTDSGWYQRLLAEPDARLTRDGVTADYRTESRPPEAAEMNRLMREKYGWRDVYIDLLMGGREDAVAVALIPAG